MTKHSHLKQFILETIQQIVSEDKRGSLKKMGLPPGIIEYFHNFYPPFSYKYADWMVKAMIDEKNTAKDFIELAIEIYKSEPDKAETISRLFQQQFNGNYFYPHAGEFKYIFKWLEGKSGLDISKFSFKEIKDKIRKEEETNKSEANGQVVKTFNDGFYWINLNTSKCDYESEKMGHCGTDDRGSIWSLRDKNKQPHITATVTDNGTIVQLKGKENKKPVAKYHKYIAELLADPNLIKNIITNDEEDRNDFQLKDLGSNGMKWVAERNPNLAARANKILKETIVKEAINNNLNVFSKIGSVEQEKIKNVVISTNKIVSNFILRFNLPNNLTYLSIPEIDDLYMTEIKPKFYEVEPEFIDLVTQQLIASGISVDNKYRIIVKPQEEDIGLNSMGLINIPIRIAIPVS